MQNIVCSFAAVMGLAIVAGTADPSRAADLTTLVSFNGTDGSIPIGRLLADAEGNLFGTTFEGGVGRCDFGCGTVFEIARTGSGYASTPTVLVYFNGANGALPLAGLIADANGNLFGTTARGGANGLGTVFEIARTGSGYASTPTILVSFNGANGDAPTAALLADANGNLFGTTNAGGANDRGTVFELVKTGSVYTLNTLVNFNGDDGAFPRTGVIADANGNLFGTTFGGGVGPCDFSGCGTVFEIVKTGSQYASAPTVLVSFNGADGARPSAVVGINGNLFGMTALGGESGLGTVFEIARTDSGYRSAPTVLVDFNGANGASPDHYSGPIADANGNLFGPTTGGGAYGRGTVFKVNLSAPPPPPFAGTPGAPNCHGVSVSALTQQYGNIPTAAAALGYPSVAALQDAIRAYCGS